MLCHNHCTGMAAPLNVSPHDSVDEILHQQNCVTNAYKESLALTLHD